MSKVFLDVSLELVESSEIVSGAECPLSVDSHGLALEDAVAIFRSGFLGSGFLVGASRHQHPGSLLVDIAEPSVFPDS
jgi:hypothetical protein